MRDRLIVETIYREKSIILTKDGLYHICHDNKPLHWAEPRSMSAIWHKEEPRSMSAIWHKEDSEVVDIKYVKGIKAYLVAPSEYLGHMKEMNRNRYIMDEDLRGGGTHRDAWMGIVITPDTEFKGELRCTQCRCHIPARFNAIAFFYKVKPRNMQHLLAHVHLGEIWVNA